MPVSARVMVTVRTWSDVRHRCARRDATVVHHCRQPTLRVRDSSATAIPR